MAAPKPLTTGKNLEKFREQLSAAREGGQPWFVLGEIYAQALATAADADLSALRTAAAEASRLSVGVLRRYVVLLQRLRAIAASEGLARDALVSRVFNAAEVAARIYDLDPEKGMTALTDLKAGAATLQELRGRLAELPPALEETRPEREERPTRRSVERGVAVIRARELKAKFMLGALERRMADLWAPEARLRRRPATLFYTSHQGFEIIGGGSSDRPMAGIELFILDGEAGAELRYFEGVFASYLVLATFYPKFCFAFSPSTPDDSVARAAELLALFGAASIGVVKVTSQGDIQKVLEPKGSPVPDRTGAYDILWR